MADSNTSLKIALKSEMDELARFSDAVEDFLDAHAFAEKDRFEIQLCLEEVFTNIVNFGFDDLELHDIDVHLELDGDRKTLVIRVIDDGNPFDPPAATRSEDLDSLIEDHAMGGIGYRLIRRYVDDIAYDRSDGHNRLTLTKQVTLQPPRTT